MTRRPRAPYRPPEPTCGVVPEGEGPRLACVLDPEHVDRGQRWHVAKNGRRWGGEGEPPKPRLVRVGVLIGAYRGRDIGEGRAALVHVAELDDREHPVRVLCSKVPPAHVLEDSTDHSKPLGPGVELCPTCETRRARVESSRGSR